VSSKRRLRRSACTGKDRYFDETVAARYRSAVTVSYLCRWCGFWHNGHPRGSAAGMMPRIARVRERFD
jgi:hypothetical protein